jgi:hypothetical protein
VIFDQNLVFRDIFKDSGRQVDLQQPKLFIQIEMSSFTLTLFEIGKNWKEVNK